MSPKAISANTHVFSRSVTVTLVNKAIGNASPTSLATLLPVKCRLYSDPPPVYDHGMGESSESQLTGRHNPTVSAGGVVLAERNGIAYILLVKRIHNVEEKWAPVLCQLPKGKVDEGESLQETAIREVREETGYACEIIRKAGVAFWSYERSGKLWHETVHYFLMIQASSITEEMDGEFDEVVWVPLAEAELIISYPEEKDLIRNFVTEYSGPSTQRRGAK